MRPVYDNPADVVRWMGAVQSQDYLASLWAVGLRTAGAVTQSGVVNQSTVERALADRSVVHTHFMRNTVHLVAPEDLRWMMRLVAPRIRMIIDNISRTEKLGLNESVYARSNEIIANALVGGRQLTRRQLAPLLAKAGLRTDGRLMLITQRAQTDGVICQAVRRGAEYSLALVDDWVPAGRDLEGDEALAELAWRYFRGHGPATVRDFAWWSGLTLSAARRGHAIVSSTNAEPRLDSVTVDDNEYWFAEPPPTAVDRDAIHLLANYDEYTVGYKDRSAVFDPVNRDKVPSPGHNILFVNTIAVDGQILGTWKRTRKHNATAVEASCSIHPPRRARSRWPPPHTAMPTSSRPRWN
jgi:hypothetical protein